MDERTVTPIHKTAILVDGAFYRKRAYNLFGDKDPVARAQELAKGLPPLRALRRCGDLSA